MDARGLPYRVIPDARLEDKAFAAEFSQALRSADASAPQVIELPSDWPSTAQLDLSVWITPIPRDGVLRAAVMVQLHDAG